MFPRNVTIAEAAQFSQVSIADYRADMAQERQALRDKLASRSKVRADIVAGLVAFAVVFSGAVALLALGVL